jgi:DNA end-binding protein Ku
VKGYEIEKDEYVIVEPEDFAKANVEKTHTIDIQDFVLRHQIDPAYFDTPYYLVPQGRAAKAYVLLRDALAKKKSVAIATFVLRTREHLVALMPVGDAIMLETLRFGHELKPIENMPLPSPAQTKDIGIRELDMAERLIEEMMTDFDATKYKDRYYGDVMALIEEKAKTGVAKAHFAEKKGAVAHDVVDLLDLLKKSVAASKGGERPPEPRAERKGPGLKKAHRRAVRRAS